MQGKKAEKGNKGVTLNALFDLNALLALNTL